MEHPIVTHLLYRHHALLRHGCESLSGGFDGYFDGVLIWLIVGQKPLLPLHLWVGMPLARGDIMHVNLLSIMALMGGHDIEVDFIGRKTRVQGMHMEWLNNWLTTLHLNDPLTNCILPCAYILYSSQGGPTCHIESDLVGIPAAVRLQQLLLKLTLRSLLLCHICGWLMVDDAGLYLALQKLRRR